MDEQPTPTPQHDWQPIDTAPKDGSRILAWEPGHAPYIADFDDYGWLTTEDWAGDGTGYYIPVCEPTHWMPLPAPPRDATR